MKELKQNWDKINVHQVVKEVIIYLLTYLLKEHLLPAGPHNLPSGIYVKGQMSDSPN